MKGIILCEESQAVTIAFRQRQHEFYSCDILPPSGGQPDWHLQSDARLIWHNPGVEFIGAHNPCTFLANSGVRWLISEKEKNGYIYNAKIGKFYNPERWEQMVESANFFKETREQIIRVGKGYLENPIMHKYAMEIIQAKPSQVLQPWMFGHGETKATCLWLVGLPLLKPTDIVDGRDGKCWKMPPSADRAKLRSKTYQGIAAAMASQWG